MLDLSYIFINLYKVHLGIRTHALDVTSRQVLHTVCIFYLALVSATLLGVVVDSYLTYFYRLLCPPQLSYAISPFSSPMVLSPTTWPFGKNQDICSVYEGAKLIVLCQEFRRKFVNVGKLVDHLCDSWIDSTILSSWWFTHLSSGC